MTRLSSSVAQVALLLTICAFLFFNDFCQIFGEEEDVPSVTNEEIVEDSDDSEWSTLPAPFPLQTEWSGQHASSVHDDPLEQVSSLPDADIQSSALNIITQTLTDFTQSTIYLPIPTSTTLNPTPGPIYRLSSPSEETNISLNPTSGPTYRSSTSLEEAASPEPTPDRPAGPEHELTVNTDDPRESAEGEVDQNNAESSASIATTTSSSFTWIPAVSTGKPELFSQAHKYIEAIMTPNDTEFERLSCPAPNTDRYEYLKVASTKSSKKPKYFFALDLYESAHVLPRLLGSIIETIRFLGPNSCVLSVIEGRSQDGTYEILAALEHEMEKLGAKYYLKTSDIDPKGDGSNRIQALADLRNAALAPLHDTPSRFDMDTTIIFINDVAICMEDILELVHQRVYQKADMTCAMDWINDASLFYDVWISRQITGDLFFEIPQNGGWDYAENLFWNDPTTRRRLDEGKPFQAFACWNGATAFTARPLLQGKIKFRSNHEGECYLGEPVHFAKDMWREGYGKITVVPSVNVGYSDEQSGKAKERRGRVGQWLEKQGGDEALVEWEREPPKHIKCVTSYERPSWERWDS